MQKTKIITLEYQVRCDRCGAPIRVGEKCRLTTDDGKGRVRFEHLRCPGGIEALLRLPKFPLLPMFQSQPVLA